MSTDVPNNGDEPTEDFPGLSEEDLEALRAYGEAAIADQPPGADGNEQDEEPTGGAQPSVGDFDRLMAERDEYLDALRRLQAEFDNYRKRTVRQQTELLERAAEGLLERLLPVVDAMELAVAHAEASEVAAEDVASFRRISSLLGDVLAKDGLERLGEEGEPFDPTVHDAVAHVAAEDGAGEAEPDSAQAEVIAEVLRPGYRLKGRVIRPAMVKVRG
ncbi:MAG: GrpE protein [Acidimicrobiaceae bacterium]|nr:GrpE protein [Acidimicrobiaceae bacterium]